MISLPETPEITLCSPDVLEDPNVVKIVLLPGSEYADLNPDYLDCKLTVDGTVFHSILTNVFTSMERKNVKEILSSKTVVNIGKREKEPSFKGKIMTDPHEYKLFKIGLYYNCIKSRTSFKKLKELFLTHSINLCGPTFKDKDGFENVLAGILQGDTY